MIDKEDIVWTKDGDLKRGSLAPDHKFLIAALAHQAFPGVFAGR